MLSWWSSIGELSLIAGFSLGLVWAFVSTTRRRRKFLRSSVRPVGQLRWFLLNLVSMSCYLSLVVALGLASHHDLLPATMLWFLLGLSGAAFAAALMFPIVPVPASVKSTDQEREPPVDPPVFPLRKSA